MKKKMNLDELKVTSFVTKVEGVKEETVKGGAPVPVQFTVFDPICVWISELYTACNCPETEIPLCLPTPEL